MSSMKRKFSAARRKRLPNKEARRLAKASALQRKSRTGKLSAAQRQRYLVSASEAYMDGLISIRELEAAERCYAADYDSALLGLAEAR